MVLKRTAAINELNLEIASVYENLELVLAETESFMAAHGADDELAFRASLLATEAVTNAMKHGNGFDPEKEVKVDLFTSGNHEFTITVEDEGSGFSRDQVADPMQEENLLHDNGRGIFLIESMADEYRYEKNGQKIIMVFRPRAV